MSPQTTVIPDRSHPVLLAADEPAPWRVVNPAGRRPLLLVCEHASSRVPRALADLGLPADELGRHIGVDIGAEALTLSLAERLDAPAVLAAYSRLVVDHNRTLDDPTLIPPVSDLTEVPGNVGLTAADRQRRLDALYHPFHTAVTARIDAMRADGVPPALVGVHSFTPLLREAQRRGETLRPWHVGILWNEDGRIARPLLDALRAEGDLVVGDNQPYSGRGGRGHTAHIHGDAPGLPWVMLEIRQDLIADAAGVAAWANRLARLLPPILDGLAPPR